MSMNMWAYSASGGGGAVKAESSPDSLMCFAVAGSGLNGAAGRGEAAERDVQRFCFLNFLMAEGKFPIKKEKK